MSSAAMKEPPPLPVDVRVQTPPPPPPSTGVVTAESAFVQSDKHTLGDLKLQPWTPERIMHAKTLGMVYPNLSKEDWEQLRKTNVYPNAPKDVSIFVYLSTLKPEEVDGATWDEAKSFGIKKGYHMTDSEEFWGAYNKFVEVNEEIRVSKTVPKSAPGAGTDGDEDLEGND